MSKVFISYSRADVEKAEELAEALEKEGIDFFLDSTGIVAGQSFTDQLGRELLEQEIRKSDVIALLLSHNSKRSHWVEKDWQTALESKKLVVPVLLDEEGTENWVWPLVSDRMVWHATEDRDLGQLAKEIRCFEPTLTEAATPPEPVAACAEPPAASAAPSAPVPKASKGTLTAKLVVTALLSAGIGALVVWLIMQGN
ncbi:TIR domain protein [Haloferula helveola]|uniref:TIR domain protein n=1 Tax=Haloferula helveola TaxID=490095 RepID=A0ABM7RCZ4_9BACT|nr:TIR domain protein [Haloferula helveola]